jgi:hypothetical protein
MSRGFSRGGGDRGFGGRGGGGGFRGGARGGRGGFQSYGPPDTVQGMSSFFRLIRVYIDQSRDRIFHAPSRIRDALFLDSTNKGPILQRPNLPRKQDANR